MCVCPLEWTQAYGHTRSWAKVLFGDNFLFAVNNLHVGMEYLKLGRRKLHLKISNPNTNVYLHPMAHNKSSLLDHLKYT